MEIALSVFSSDMYPVVRPRLQITTPDFHFEIEGRPNLYQQIRTKSTHYLSTRDKHQVRCCWVFDALRLPRAIAML